MGVCVRARVCERDRIYFYLLILKHVPGPVSDGSSVPNQPLFWFVDGFYIPPLTSDTHQKFLLFLTSCEIRRKKKKTALKRIKINLIQYGIKGRNCNRCKKSLTEDTNRQNKDISTK